MAIVSVLKRKDAASVIVAVVIAMILGPLLTSLTAEVAQMISGLDDGQNFSYAGPGNGWQNAYLFPVVWAVSQLLLLEALIRVYALVHDAVSKK